MASQDDRRLTPTRHALDGLDSDTSGFVLADDVPPEFVQATTRYEILSELGRGGAGIVYKARDLALRRKVAIKILRLEFIDQPDMIRRFEQEAQAICHLQHPGIAPVFECGFCSDGRPFHSMKLVDGHTMLRMIDNLPEENELRAHAITAFTQVCQTIGYTHSRNVVHLDLKPTNFMIGAFGEVHVMDWGTARFLDVSGRYRSVSMTKHAEDRSRLVGGTLSYMPPEQASGGLLDTRSDVFSLGASLFHILTGEPLYQADRRGRLYRQAIKCDMSAAHDRLQNCGADSALVRLAINCLQKDPSNRPASAGQVAREISAHQDASLLRFQSDMARFFELSLDLFCIAGLDGHFRRINANFSRVLGYEEDVLLSRPFMDFVHPDDMEKTTAAMAQLLDGKPVIRFRNRYRTSGGGFLEFEWTAKSIPAEGLIFAVARNVSQSE